MKLLRHGQHPARREHLEIETSYHQRQTALGVLLESSVPTRACQHQMAHVWLASTVQTGTVLCYSGIWHLYSSTVNIAYYEWQLRPNKFYAQAFLCKYLENRTGFHAMQNLCM